MGKAMWIITAGVCACLFLYIIEQVLDVNYAVKTAVKLVLFILLPLFYVWKIKQGRLSEILALKNAGWRGLIPAFLFGFAAFSAVLAAFFILQESIDLAAIAYEMETKLGITPQVFVFVAFYVTFLNSLLEEFFFRGFLFLELHRLGYRTTAYVFSSLLFGLYHIAIFQSWFSLPVTLLALAGLIGVGFLFDWLVSRSDSFISSWIVHIFADIAIVLIGFHMFGMFS
ncbi:CPBP family intramembrane glutamic endopeptidase [Indiicoccus explosivorum]|uniref:CPBP family intramembrane glutamic endopeptidase n=1 Tax=Indiicoccus explosivorum TaxID=1917864 RepID=UPI0013900944|nr:CPBP family intramembrane glutamic endopeptidase [Indiicoccus explosivorum]